VTGLALDVLAAGLHLLFLLYAVLVLVHLALQVGCAGLHARRARQAHERALARTAERTDWPDVDVLVPVYNEHPDDLDRCCASLAAQDYPGRVRVVLVDDGSPNRDDVLPVLERHGAREGWSVVLLEANAGKRAAQSAAIDRGSAELVLTIDSDTQLAPDGVLRLVEQFDDPRVGAATGDVRVSNASTNLLTRLVDLRYWVAFSQERASHALFGAVLCCSGPMSMYRRRVLRTVWPRYAGQVFRGVPCTYGDDRHLTNLVLGEGWRTAFAPFAGCFTSAPTTEPAYLRQQMRWNKSYYRELLWTLAFLPRLSRVMAVEVGVQALLPFLLVLAMLATVGRSLVDGPQVLVRYAVVVAVMAVLHCLFALVRTRDPRFLLFVVYGFLHAALLVPVRVKALLTLDDNAWGTRTGVARALTHTG
jgi:chitooligosaccharide synthase NodC